MSFYRQSPSKRSPYSRSPVKILESQRDFIEEQIKLKNAYRSQAQNRRLLDQLSILQIKTRKIDELDARCEALAKQNALLSSQNDQLAKELSERRYQTERIRSSSIQLQQRDTYKSAQLGQINQSLEIQIDLLKKERIQSTKLYQTHIQKLQIMLQNKIKQNESLSIKCNDLLNQNQISQIRFEQQRNKLKNMMSRTSYDLERQLEYTKQKQNTQKFVEIQTLKKNYTSQVVLLEDQISKLKGANAYKNNQFQGQLQENRNLKNRYEDQLKNSIHQNDIMRGRILKLQQMNKTEVENIQQKYSNIHAKGTSSLKQQHQRQIRLLLDQIDRQKWIINQKNNQIQHLIRQKRDQQSSFRDRQLSLVTQIQTLKNKLSVQEVQGSQRAHQLMNTINEVQNKNLRDNQNYYERVKDFQQKIKELERQVNHKQAEYQNIKATRALQIQQLGNQIDDLVTNLRKTTDALNQSKEQHKSGVKQYDQYRTAKQSQRGLLTQRMNQLQVLLQNQRQAVQGLGNDSSNNEELLQIQIKSLRETVNVLQKKLSQQQQAHSKEMADLSSNLRDRIQKLQATNKQLFEQTGNSHKNQIATLRRRIQKLERQKQDMESKLQEYITLYQGLEKYFNEPHKQAVFKEKASSSIYEVLDKTSNTTIHIF